ncbi:hypothetical protein ACIQI7_22530 [Kitasatospora sp. NPDC092039]|uniref:recombination directionality factor n=1 Tax=Kitasatospora sp. NPDC092039 TaxID=3364086 RepID=UPI00382B4B5A
MDHPGLLLHGLSEVSLFFAVSAGASSVRGRGACGNRSSGRVVGRFHASGPAGEPAALDHGWRVSMSSREEAAALAGLLGGDVRTGRSGSEWITRRDRFEITLDGPQSLDFRMVTRGRQGEHVCDGVRHLRPATIAGEACGCPPTWSQRRAASRAGRGPKPEITLRFRLVEAPEAGPFGMLSSSWVLTEDIDTVLGRLDGTNGPVTAGLSIDRRSFITPAGIEVVGQRPRLRLLSSVP